MNCFPKYSITILLALQIIIINKAIALQHTAAGLKNKSVTIKAAPVVDFSFTNDNTCSGTVIEFTSTVTGTAPFSYDWDFGDGQNSTAKNPTHIYNAVGCGTETFTITLTVTDADNVQSSETKTINVIQKPDISFGDQDAEIGEEDFSNCANASIENQNYSITVENNSASKACIDSYSIDWGDGSSATNVTFPIYHEYTSLGAFNMVITAKGSNGCENSVVYVVKNQTNPSGGITSPGETQDLCAPTKDLEFAISGWGTNSPGTTYLVDYGDGTTFQISQEDMVATSYFNSTDPSSSANYPIPHAYSTSSCPNPSFTVNLIISNACSSTPAAVGNITIITKPEPDFTASPTCVNSTTIFTNKTISGSGKNCTPNANFTWDFGDGSPVVEQKNTEPKDVSHVYTTPGDYTVTLTAINNTACGESSITKTITISSPPTATISGSTNVCLGEPSPAITFTGADSAAPYTFTYKINNGPNKTVSTAANSNEVTIDVPTDVAGTFTYSLVSVGASSCSQSQTGEAVIVVNSAPTATISGADTVCINSDAPRIMFQGFDGQEPYTFTYNVNGGTSKTLTTISGDTVSIEVLTNIGGTFSYILTGVKDDNANASACTLALNDTVTITINDQLPDPLVLDDYEFCNGETTSPIIFSNPVPGTTYSWTNSNPAIGLADKGNGDIPVFTAINLSDSTILSTITVIPTYNGCVGTSQTFTISVLPAATVSFSPEDQIICSGESTTEVILSSSAAGASINWTTEQPPGISETVILSGTTSIPAQTLTNTTNQPITLVYKAIANLSATTVCPSVESYYTITVFPKPVITEQPMSGTVCPGEEPEPLSVSLTNAGGDPEYQWYSNTANSTTGGTVLVNETNSVFSPPTPFADKVWYYCIITFPESGCDTLISDIAVITVYPMPTVFLNGQELIDGDVFEFCYGDSLLLHATGAENYIWNDGSSGDSILITREGDYSVIITSSDGCIDTIDFSASQYEKTDIQIQSDRTEITTDLNTVHFWSDFYPNSEYFWDFGDGKTGEGDDVYHTFESRDGYFVVTLKMINQYGCANEDSIRIWSRMTSMPNTFTPNGDGKNDVYMRDWNIKIYSRNGILLYAGREGWDGTYKGNPVKNDTYFVVVHFPSETGNRYETNYVTVIR